MAGSRIRKALGAVKDQTSIGLAKVSSNSNAVSDLEVAIVKATRHDEHPAEEKHIREILSLTCYSRQYVTACVNTISRRLSKTRSWTVALKTLVLVHRLLIEGDPAYEQEIFFATRRGTRLLNMSDFRDTASRSGSWDFSAFVRTFAMYLDERLEYRMHGRRNRRRSRSAVMEEEDEEGGGGGAPGAVSVRATPVRELQTERIFNRTQHLQQLLERFLACRPTGAAKSNRIVAVALYPLVKESYQLYYDLTEIMGIFIDRFMELEVPQCVRVYDVFSRLAKQFDDLGAFYAWCKLAGIARSSDYPEVDRITQKKLDVMDEFIRDKSALASRTRSLHQVRDPPEDEDEEDDRQYEINGIKALPAPEEEEPVDAVEEKESIVAETAEEKKKDEEEEEEEEVDFLNLKADVEGSGEDQANKLALALFDGPVGNASAPPKWEAFADDQADWETALVLSASTLPHQKASLGGGFDVLMLDGMYQQPQPQPSVGTGSASSVAFPARGQGMLALPAPPGGGSSTSSDPFEASAVVAPPSYVQMSDMEKKQHLLVQEQVMWQQYAKDGMQGQLGIAKLQQAFPYYQQQQQRY